MTATKIKTSSGFTMNAPVNSKQYFKTSSFLCRTNHFNNARIEKHLYKCNPMYAIVRGYIIAHTTAHKTKSFLDAVTVEFDKDWYKGILGRDIARKYIQDFIEFGLLVKPNGRKQIYYVNPLMSHYLTIEQREEYGNKYLNLFPMISIPITLEPEL